MDGLPFLKEVPNKNKSITYAEVVCQKSRTSNTGTSLSQQGSNNTATLSSHANSEERAKTRTRYSEKLVELKNIKPKDRTDAQQKEIKRI